MHKSVCYAENGLATGTILRAARNYHSNSSQSNSSVRPGFHAYTLNCVLEFYRICFVGRDPEMYPEPENFNPNRFLKGGKRPQLVFLPFSEASQKLMGMRMGVTQVKFGVISLLRHFRWTPSAESFQNETKLKACLTQNILLNFEQR